MTIIILKRRFVDVGVDHQPCRLGGEFSLSVVGADGSVRRSIPWFKNLVLDAGLNRWGSGGIIGGAAIGTGTSTPVASQSSLDSQTHYTSTPGTGHGAYSIGSAPDYANSYTAVYRTALGALNGNYTEVGVGWASGLMFSRALIVDALGSPTSISVASDEQLDIAYRLSMYPPLLDTLQTVTISGVDYEITGRSSLLGSSAWNFSVSQAVEIWNPGSTFAVAAGPIGLITGQPSGDIGSSTFFGISNSAYVPGSFSRNGSISIDLTRGNISGGIGASVVKWRQFVFQYGISPKIPKDSTKTLVLNYTASWARRP